MVFFNCNNCSEALKGNKIEGHRNKCNFSTVTCVDCLKDFDITTFRAHKTCMTEDQRYGGKNYVGKDMKGQRKQEEWLCKLQNLISSSKFSKDIENHLNRIINYDNIPRKKAKFINFVKASIVKDDRVAEKLWSIIEQALKPSPTQEQRKPNGHTENKSTNAEPLNESSTAEQPTQTTNGNQSNESTNGNQQDDVIGKKRKTDDQNQETKKLKLTDKDLNESSADQDASISKVIENLIERAKETQTPINPTKLTKKVLKRKENKEMRLKKFKKLIRRLVPYTEFKDLPANEFYDKFIEKLNEKECFTVDKEIIAYRN